MSVRKQSGCVVFRYNKKFNYEVLLVKSSDGKDWVFPKGGVEEDLTAKDSAIKEVYEEAGVSGKIVETLGKYEYTKRGKPQKVTMYSMIYTHDTPDWPEEHLRKRKWFNLKDARKKLPKLLRPFLDELERSESLALSGVDPLKALVDQFRSLPVISDVNGVVEYNEEDESIDIVLQVEKGELAVRVSHWAQHPMSRAVIVRYELEGLEAHTKRTTLDKVVGKTARIIGHYRR